MLLMAMSHQARKLPMMLRSSPTPEGRCCSPPVGTGSVSTTSVAILTDPGGSVLHLDLGHRRGPALVAILTDPGGSVLPRAFAAQVRSTATPLRSSPTPEGRCCSRSCGEVAADAHPVAILTDPGGSVLRE